MASRDGLGRVGIGRAVALVWAREGARVVLSDLDEDQGQETAALVRELGAEALFLRADASSAKDHEELVALDGIYAHLWQRQTGGFLIEQQTNEPEGK